MHDDDATLPDTGGGADPAPAISEADIDRRYDLGPVLGKGGMGEVRLARDTRIDREVAIKLMRGGQGDRDLVARFFREARVQGALEHPAVVPVHDLGIDRAGQPYFVMKRLAGTTLADVLAQRAASNAPDEVWPRRLLLTRLVDVTLAIAFAHTRGVVHRDLKPANLMLGDFGEAYVLDWGLARITAEDSPISSVQPLSGEEQPGQTEVGALLGTPGYMAPEQARGGEVDVRADIYALGCVLFEILAGAAALPRGLAAIAETLEAREHRPSARSPDVPPELDDLCARATAQDPAARPTARELAAKIQAYLDGDRDLERRRELAVAHLAVAQRAMTSTGDEARSIAMREAGRALVLDPTSTEAQQLLAHLVLDPPSELPAGARAAADEARGEMRQRMLRWAALTYFAVVPILAILFIFPIRHLWPIVGAMLLATALAAFYWWLARRVLPMRSPLYPVVILLNTALLTCGAFIFGPLLILPLFVIGSLAGFLVAPVRYPASVIVISHMIPLVLPLLLELTGVTPSTFEVQHGSLVLTPLAVDLTPVGAVIILIASTLSQYMNSTLIALSERSGRDQALDQVHAQSWHLRQLLPRAFEPGDPPTDVPPK